MRNLADYQEQYERLPFEDTQALYRKKKIRESLQSYRPGVILEVGCGLDPLFSHYTDFEHMVVVEPGETFASNARRRSRDDPRVTIVDSTLEECKDRLVSWQFDFIVVSSLLHEVDDPDNLLRDIRQLCDPTTVVHVNVPNAYSFHRLLARAMGLIKDIHEQSATQISMQQPRIFDRSSLTDIAERNGFGVLESGSFFIKPFTHAQMATLRAAGLLSDAVLDGLFSLSDDLPDHGSELYMNLRAAP